MKQVELAEAIGVSEATISRILAGRRRPSWNIAKKLAAATESSVIVWMDGSQEQKTAAMKNANGEG